LMAPDGTATKFRQFPERGVLEQALANSAKAKKRPPPCDARPCLFVRLPPPREIAEDLAKQSSAQGAIEVVNDEAQAQYILAARSQSGQVQLAWVLAAAAAAPDTNRPASGQLPNRTKWFNALGPDENTGTVAELADRALRLARLRAWLKLETPPDDGDFPYHLAIERNGKVLDPGTPLVDKDQCRLVLVADPAKLARGTTPRWVYVIGIDSEGKVTLLFPLVDHIGLENRFPIIAADSQTGKLPELIPLGSFNVESPFGRDSYVLLASREPIPNIQYLEQEGVTRGAGGGEGRTENPLTLFLLSRGKTRGVAKSTPTDWSSERIEVESKARPAASKAD
jgi:hypothetical protein